MRKNIKIEKAKMKLSDDGIFAIIGVGRCGEERKLICKINSVEKVKIDTDGFSIKLINNDTVYRVNWRSLSENPSVPSRKVFRNRNTDNILFFLYDLVAEVAFDGARDNGLPHDATIERLKTMYPNCEKYYKGSSLKYIGSQILINYKR